MCEQAKKEGGGDQSGGGRQACRLSRKRKDAEGKGALNLVWATAEGAVSKEMSRAEKAGMGMRRHKDGFIAEYIATGGGPALFKLGGLWWTGSTTLFEGLKEQVQKISK